MKEKFIVFISALLLLLFVASIVYTQGQITYSRLSNTKTIDCNSCEKKENCSEEDKKEHIKATTTPILSNTSPTNKVEAIGACPYNAVNCVAPGKCQKYIDSNKDSICDFSKIVPTTSPSTSEKCPYDAVNCFAPGKCKKYTDANNDYFCDYSKIVFSTSPSATPNSTSDKKCPYDAVNCASPGKCQKYTDANKDSYCDYSKIVNSNSPITTANSTLENKCPYDVVNCPSPGKCRKYIDKNSNNFCDLSEPPTKTVNTQISNFLKDIYDIKIILLIVLSLIGLITFNFKIGTKIRLASLAVSVALLGFYFGGCPTPVGSTQLIFQNFDELKKVGFVWILVFIIPILCTLLMGRIYCGYVCPFGAIQGILNFIGKKLHIRLNINSTVDFVLKKLKFVFLIVFIFLSVILSTRWFCKIDPFRKLFVLYSYEEGFKIPNEILDISIIAFVILTSLIFGRFICMYLCPYGAILSLFNKFTLVKTVNNKDCKKCVKCEDSCPVKAIKKGEIDQSECIKCGNCINACPFK